MTTTKPIREISGDESAAGSDSTTGSSASSAIAQDVTPASTAGSESTPTAEGKKVKYTAKVRRGFNIFVRNGMVARAAEVREQQAGRPRNDRYTNAELDDLDAAVAFMVQEAIDPKKQ